MEPSGNLRGSTGGGGGLESGEEVAGNQVAAEATAPCSRSRRATGVAALLLFVGVALVALLIARCASRIPAVGRSQQGELPSPGASGESEGALGACAGAPSDAAAPPQEGPAAEAPTEAPLDSEEFEGETDKPPGVEREAAAAPSEGDLGDLRAFFSHHFYDFPKIDDSSVRKQLEAVVSAVYRFRVPHRGKRRQRFCFKFRDVKYTITAKEAAVTEAAEKLEAAFVEAMNTVESSKPEPSAWSVKKEVTAKVDGNVAGRVEITVKASYGDFQPFADGTPSDNQEPPPTENTPHTPTPFNEAPVMEELPPAPDEAPDVQEPDPGAANEALDTQEPPAGAFNEASDTQEPPAGASNEASDMQEPQGDASGEGLETQEPPAGASDDASEVQEPPAGGPGDAPVMEEPQPAASDENFEMQQAFPAAVVQTPAMEGAQNQVEGEDMPGPVEQPGGAEEAESLETAAGEDVTAAHSEAATQTSPKDTREAAVGPDDQAAGVQVSGTDDETSPSGGKETPPPPSAEDAPPPAPPAGELEEAAGGGPMDLSEDEDPETMDTVPALDEQHTMYSFPRVPGQPAKQVLNCLLADMVRMGQALRPARCASYGITIENVSVLIVVESTIRSFRWPSEGEAKSLGPKLEEALLDAVQRAKEEGESYVAEGRIVLDKKLTYGFIAGRSTIDILASRGTSLRGRDSPEMHLDAGTLKRTKKQAPRGDSTPGP
ncbi:hypothetical protein Efla_005064 [Eimeria flavescens]